MTAQIKTNHMRKLLTLTSIVSPVVILALMAGCQTVATNQAELATSKKENLLVQAGFKAKSVTTPKQQQRVSQLAVDRVSAVKYQGKLYYVFPTAKKDQILVGNQSQFNAYKRALQAQQASQTTQQTQQQQQMLQGSPVWAGETAGPRHVDVEVFDGFGPLNPMQGD
jgi:lipopolysaccharide export LptBFGC system permease protein LptF